MGGEIMESVEYLRDRVDGMCQKLDSLVNDVNKNKTDIAVVNAKLNWVLVLGTFLGSGILTICLAVLDKIT